MKEKQDNKDSSMPSNGKSTNGTSLKSNSEIDDKLGNLIFDLVDTIHTMGLPVPAENQANKPK